MTAARHLRTLLARDELLIAPGAYDGISAMTIQQAGFSLAYMTGSGTAASLGYPDIGLVTMSEMVERAATIARAIDIPLIADADTGYGNELNVTRTVREYEARGVAGLHIEDQVTPKKCGHLDGKEIVPREEFVSKIRAAAAARRSPDFLLIARTDARAVAGLDEAIARANAALQAGADMAFVEAPQTLEEVALVPQRVHGPCLLNLVGGGKTPAVGFDEAQAMGYRLAILPGALFRSAIATFDRVLDEIKTQRRLVSPPAQGVAGGFQRFGLDAWQAIGQRARTA
ncbi:isocitrate lyase/PEP mutase family protein [Pseudorhodoferax sp.]|uniref:isocitrate lyase/PEP mutase family protein n=1 Tax=Pseudorhodoferax sp. TaxID=1993553 RepID=UPI002DD67E9A|nr:isocitrate lyase/PEP mutase family protein [Pseudorhodoferax sp.]